MFKSTDIMRAGEVLTYVGTARGGVVQRPLATGFDTWDRACDETGGRGVGDWWYTLIGGASNAGKTQLARWLARQAMEAGGTPAIITMEVGTAALQRHFYSNLTSFGYYDLLPHKWDRGSEAELKARREKLVAEVTAQGGDKPLTMVITEAEGRPTIDWIVSEAEGLLEETGITHLFVDHAQLIKSPTGMDIAAAAEELSERMRIFAHKKRVCTFMLSQLNRGASRQRDQSPTMHDLWGGTSMESNANQVILLDHSRSAADDRSPHILRTYLLLDKNREGPAKLDIPVEVNFRTGVWREASPDEEELWPT